MCCQRPANEIRDLFGTLHLQVPVVDDADRDLLVGDRPADRFEVHAVAGGALERQHVDVELVEMRQRVPVRLVGREQPLLRRIAPAGVAHTSVRSRSPLTV